MDDGTASKLCTKCGNDKPRAAFRPQKWGDGRVSQCKSCEREYQRAWYQRNREAQLAKGREWYEQNRESRAVSQRSWYEANKDRAAQRQREWAAANPGRRAELVAAWRAKNPDRDRENARAWREANREWVRVLGRRAYAADRLKYVEREHRRRALIADSTIGSVDYDALWTGLCGICEQELDASVAHPDPWSPSIDHIIPLARGGSHSQDNLQWAHLYCNVSKGAKVP